MLTIIGILMILFYVGFNLTGTIISSIVWMFVKIPVALTIGCVGLALSLTVICTSFGLALIRMALRMIVYPVM